MPTRIEDLVCLSDVAKKFKINKSKLQYYYSLGLFRETTRIGEILMFDRDEIFSQLGTINALKTQGFTLAEIKKKIYE